MGSPTHFPRFQELLEEWNRKLQESGFRDIERSQGSLKKSGSEVRHVWMDATVRDARTEYFCKLSSLVQETVFRSEQELEIMTLFSQGMNQRKIQRTLGIPGHRSRVYRPIYYWLRKWGLKP